MASKFFNTPRTSALCTNSDIRVGSIVRINKIGGGILTLKVTAIHDDVKNGAQGFDARTANFGQLKSGNWGWKVSRDGKWAYTAQVFELVRF